MGLRELLTKMARAQGIELADGDLDDLDFISVDHLDGDLPGRASGVVELFLSGPIAETKAVEDDGLLWGPIMYADQWALRPDGKGGKLRVPLKIVAGRSKNQRREIGLQDIKDAFDDEAVESVTVPESHANKPTENHGYVKRLKIAKTKFPGKDGKEKTVTALFAGYDVLEPDTKRRMTLGTVPGRSAGLLYDYERTDTGKKYPVVLEHVALTPRQWLRGMPPFGRKLAMLSDDPQVATLALSDDGPTEEEYTLALADAAEDDDFLADTAVAWNHEEDPKWIQQQINQTLLQRRAEKLKKRGANGYPYDERIPSYRCESAKATEALICDGYGDGANYWVAPFEVSNGEVKLAEFSKWSATKQVWVADDRAQPTGDQAPLSDDYIELEPLELAQARRSSAGGSLDLAVLKAKKRSDLPDSSFAISDERKFPIHDESHALNALSRASGTKYESRVRAAVKKRYPKINVSGKSPGSNYDLPRGGGEDMTEGTNQLSEAAQARIKKLEDQLAESNSRNESLAEKVDRLTKADNASSAAKFITELRAMGLSEERGFSGMLVEIEHCCLADDGGAALMHEHFAEDGNPDGTISFSDALRRIFGALKTKDGVTMKLGEVLAPSAEHREDDPNPGKPAKDDPDAKVDESLLSDDELLALHEKEHPGVLAAAGIKLSQNGGGEA